MQEFDVLAIGNAIVDVIASADEAFLAGLSISKGSFRLISMEEADSLYRQMGPGREISGGSAANTVAGVAALGGRAAFVGRVADDQLGRIFAHDIRASGVVFASRPAQGGLPTAQCLILVTPDAQRTMSTYLGCSQELCPEDIDAEAVRAARISYFEGYLWDRPNQQAAIRLASEIARAAGRKTALTLSDVFCVEGHRGAFIDLLSDQIDIVFANENEARALFQTDELESAIEGFAARNVLAVVTRSEKGAVVVNGEERIAVPAAKAKQVLDTTGAGDLFAAGFLAGHSQGRPLRECAIMGTIAAAEVIEHFGARPEEDLQARVAIGLGLGSN